jgi:cell wall-associated NlpC family hydrolase
MTPVEIARSLIGTPWGHQGRGPLFRDCIGLIVACFEQYGIRDRTNYDRNPRAGQLEADIREQFGTPIPREDMQPGDVVLMAFPRVIRHVGILADHKRGLSVIHTWAKGPRCVCETPLDEQWMRRIKLVHRWGAAP